MNLLGQKFNPKNGPDTNLQADSWVAFSKERKLVIFFFHSESKREENDTTGRKVSTIFLPSFSHLHFRVLGGHIINDVGGKLS